MRLIIILGLLILVGCSSNTEFVTPEAVYEEVEEAPVEDKAPEVIEVAEEKEETISDDHQEFIDFILKEKTVEYRAIYDVVLFTRGLREESSFTRYHRDIDTQRTDSTLNDKIRRTYIIKGVSYVCDTEFGSWGCKQTERFLSPALESIQLVIDNPQKYVATRTSSKPFDRGASTCFRANDVEGFTVEFCFTDEAIPVYVTSYGEENGDPYTYEITSTRYWKDVKTSDFELPDKGFVLP